MNIPFMHNNGGETLGGLIWWRLLLLVVVALVVLAGLFWGGKSAYNAVTDKSTPTASSGQSSQKPGEPEPSAPTAPSSPTKSSQVAQKPSNKSTSTLVNTGPADTASVFVIASTIGIVGYQIVLRRQHMVTN